MTCLRADIEELGDEAEHRVLAAPQRTLVDDARSILVLLDASLGDLGQLGEEEQDREGRAEAGDSEVGVLHGLERVRIGAGEEGLAGDQGTDEGADTVGRLGEVEAESSALG